MIMVIVFVKKTNKQIKNNTTSTKMKIKTKYISIYTNI